MVSRRPPARRHASARRRDHQPRHGGWRLGRLSPLSLGFDVLERPARASARTAESLWTASVTWMPVFVCVGCVGVAALGFGGGRIVSELGDVIRLAEVLGALSLTT